MEQATSLESFELKITNLSLVGFSKWQLPKVGLELVPPLPRGGHPSAPKRMHMAEHPRGWDLNMHVWGAAQNNPGPKKGQRRPSKMAVERMVAHLQNSTPISEEFQVRASVFESSEKMAKPAEL